MHSLDDVFATYARNFEAHREADLTLAEYLEACRDHPMMYATATERLLAAIGEAGDGRHLARTRASAGSS